MKMPKPAAESLVWAGRSLAWGQDMPRRRAVSGAW
jgi:hypothetical protein